MRITIDAVGRLVVPKQLRAELGIAGPTELDAAVRDGVIELKIPDLSAHVERAHGDPVIMAEEPVRPLTVEDVRDVIDRMRR